MSFNPGSLPITVTRAGYCAMVDARLAANDYIVLWWLASTTPTTGQLIIQSELASRLNLAIGTLARCFKNLLDAELLERVEKIGTSYVYRLNPAYFQAVAVSHGA